MGRHYREGGNDRQGWWKCNRIVAVRRPGQSLSIVTLSLTLTLTWIPACAGMTIFLILMTLPARPASQREIIV